MSDLEPDDEYSSSDAEWRSETESQVDDDEESKETKKTSKFRWGSYKNLTVESQGLTKHHFFLFGPYITGFAVLTKKWSKHDLDSAQVLRASL
jgi:hypothetical protein